MVKTARPMKLWEWQELMRLERAIRGLSPAARLTTVLKWMNEGWLLAPEAIHFLQLGVQSRAVFSQTIAEA